MTSPLNNVTSSCRNCAVGFTLAKIKQNKLFYFSLILAKRNLKKMDINWEEAKDLAADRTEWRQCIQQDAG